MESSPITEIGVTVTTGGNGANTGRWGMSWQLWVLIAAATSGLLVMLSVKIHRAQQVFEEIVDTAVTNDLARQRRRHQRQPFRPVLITHSAHPQHRSRGHH